MEPHDAISLGELSRRVQDVLTRIEGFTKRMDEQFVRRETLELVKERNDLTIEALREKVLSLEKEKAEAAELIQLKNQIAALEDDKKWLTRLILGVIILAVLGLVIVSGGGSFK